MPKKQVATTQKPKSKFSHMLRTRVSEEMLEAFNNIVRERMTTDSALLREAVLKFIESNPVEAK